MNNINDNLPAAARDRYEREFRRTRKPHITVVRRLAAETNQPIDRVKGWFKAKRGNARAPAVAPVALAVAPVAPAVAPVALLAPAIPLTPGPIVRLQKNLRMPDRIIKCTYGENYQVKIIKARVKQIGLRVIHEREKINITLPKPDFCFSNGFVAELGQNQVGNGASAEEAIFIKVLRNKLKCDICIDGLITLRCTGCQKGFCGECVVNLILYSRNVNYDVYPYRRIQCPHCRKENNPFEALSYARF